MRMVWWRDVCSCDDGVVDRVCAGAMIVWDVVVRR